MALSVKNLVCDGNSITNGHIPGGGTGTQEQDAWPVVCRGLFVADASDVKAWSVKAVAVSGATTQDRIDAFPTAVAPLFAPQLGLNVLTFFEAFNDFTAGKSVAEVIALTQAYARLAMGAGWTLLLITPTPTTNAGINASIGALNVWLRGSEARAYSSLPVLDIAADSRLADPSNSTYYQTDGVHQKPAGYAVIADLVHTRLLTL